jgi:hypothetical protein
MERKTRTEIPRDVAAQVLFASDRTCCVCNVSGLQLQIHHIDGDPSNHDAANLAVMCLQDHALTEVRGGFGRRLEAEQVRTYRDDWLRRVKERRERADQAAVEALASVRAQPPPQIHDEPIRPPIDFINLLPTMRAAAVERSQPGWDNGATNLVRQASYAYIHALEGILVALASYYPTGHFGKAPHEYFAELISDRFFWHRAHPEPQGQGTGGRIIHVLAAGGVMNDVEEMVMEMVRSLTDGDSQFDLDEWLQKWEAAAPPNDI